MTQFGRTIVDLSGWDGGPGVNVFHWCAPAHMDIVQEDVDDFHTQLHTSLLALTAGAWAGYVAVQVRATCTIHEVDTGDLVNIITTESGTEVINGVGDGQESRATQVGMRWLTNDFRFGHRVTGHTYIGPASSDVLTTSGKVNPTVQEAWPESFSGIYDNLGGRLIVWSRPVKADPGKGIEARSGFYADVTGADVAQYPFSLRRRRQ